MAGFDIYTADGEKIASLLRFMPEVKTGDVVLVKVGKEFGQTETERGRIADAIKQGLGGRVRVIVVDESATIEVIDPRKINARRS
jgi:dihydrodipicolinate synthase/N-acetylneuraminate lyase